MQIENWNINDLKEKTCPVCEKQFRIGVVKDGSYICYECFQEWKKNKKKEGDK